MYFPSTSLKPPYIFRYVSSTSLRLPYILRYEALAVEKVGRNIAPSRVYKSVICNGATGNPSSVKAWEWQQNIWNLLLYQQSPFLRDQQRTEKRPQIKASEQRQRQSSKWDFYCSIMIIIRTISRSDPTARGAQEVYTRDCKYQCLQKPGREHAQWSWRGAGQKGDRVDHGKLDCRRSSKAVAATLLQSAVTRQK